MVLDARVLKPGHDMFRIIAGAVVPDKQFKILKGLFEKGLDGFFNDMPPAVCRHDDGNTRNRGGSHINLAGQP